MTISRRARLLGVVLLGVICLSCGSDGEEAGPVEGSSTTTDQAAPALRTTQVISSSGQTYDVAESGDTITVEAPAGNDEVAPDLGFGDPGVIGVAFWPGDQEPLADQRVCVQLDSIVDASTNESIAELLADPTLRKLPGIALRVTQEEEGKVGQAITITQAGRTAAVWVFDVDAVRIDRSGDRAIADSRRIASVDFREVLGKVDGLEIGDVSTTMKPPPWHLCAQLVGTQLLVKAWTGDDEPTWSDSDAVREERVPPSWVYEGYAGGYMLGLSPGTSATFTGLEVTRPY